MKADFRQCEGIVVMGRSKTGGRGKLQAPRRCRRVAQCGDDYCEIHASQADIQGLYRELLVSYWEMRVERWERARR